MRRTGGAGNCAARVRKRNGKSLGVVTIRFLTGFLLLLVPVARGSLIVDRAPEARAIAEVFIDSGDVRVEWDLRDGKPEPKLVIQAAGKRPDRVTIAPPPNAEPKRIAVVVYHRGLPVSDLHYLEGEETVVLDWQDAWRSRFLDPRLRRTYDTPVGVFLYVGRYEVRVEILGRPIDFGIQRIDPAAVQGQVTAFLDGRWRLTVDGETVRPPLDRCQFLERRLRATTAVAAPGPDEVRSSTLGVVYRLRRDRLPERVELEWSAFPENLPRLAAAVTEDFFMEPAVLDRQNNVLRWQRSQLEAEAVPRPVVPSPGLRLPGYVAPVSGVLLVLMLGWIVWKRVAGRGPARWELMGVFLLGALVAVTMARHGADVPKEPVARRIVGGLIENIYHAFDYPDDEAIYDALAQSISGDYLRDAFLEVRRALEVERTGGASIRVREVTVEETHSSALPDGRGFRTNARWTVAGSVAHWGHIHARRNRYSGVISIEPIDGAWKITGLELDEEERLY